MFMSELPQPRIDRLRKALDFAKASYQQRELHDFDNGSGTVPVEIEGNGTINLEWDQGQWFRGFGSEEAATNNSIAEVHTNLADGAEWFKFDATTTKDYDDPSMPEGICGTAACIAGFGVIAFGKVEGLRLEVSGQGRLGGDWVTKPEEPSFYGCDIATAAKRFVFGLTDQEAERLFDASNTEIEDLEDIIGKIEAGEFRRGYISFNGSTVVDAPHLQVDGSTDTDDDEDEEN